MLTSKVYNLESPRTGKPVANQFVIEGIRGIEGNFTSKKTFQSYDSIIAVITVWDPPATPEDRVDIVLDPDYWDYSVTTLKYLKQFLSTNKSKSEIAQAIESGEYKAEKLNR